MVISELKARQGSVDVEVEVVDKGEIRQFEKFGRPGRVCNAKVRDDSGEISLTLWNDDIDKIDVGDKLKISNGYVSEWQGELQLTTGKFGRLEIVEKGSGVPGSKDEGSSEQTFTNDEKTEEELLEGSESDEGEHIMTEDEKTEEEVLEERSSDNGENILDEDEKQEEEILDQSSVEEEVIEDEISDDEKEEEELTERFKSKKPKGK